MNITYLSNHFLIAMPDMADANFTQTVLYVCEHNADGALGIVINRPTSVNLGEAFKQMDITPSSLEAGEQPILFGGPINQENGYVIHRPRGHWRETIGTSTELGITSSQDILRAIANDEGPDKALVALGYAGWGAGQLEHELAQNIWLSCPVDTEILFDTPFEDRWRKSAQSLGIDNIYQLTSMVGEA
jgi:putative transcriptional regulator